MEAKLKQMQKEAVAMKQEYKDLIDEHAADRKQHELNEKQREKRKTWSRKFWRRATIDGSKKSLHVSSSSSIALPVYTEKANTPHSMPAKKSVRIAEEKDASKEASSVTPHAIRNPAMIALMKYHEIQSQRI